MEELLNTAYNYLINKEDIKADHDVNLKERTHKRTMHIINTPDLFIDCYDVIEDECDYFELDLNEVVEYARTWNKELY